MGCVVLGCVAVFYCCIQYSGRVQFIDLPVAWFYLLQVTLGGFRLRVHGERYGCCCVVLFDAFGSCCCCVLTGLSVCVSCVFLPDSTHQAPPAVLWPPVFARKAPCVSGHGMALDAARGLVVVSPFIADYKLYVYSLADGSLVRSFGGQGSGKGQLNWSVGGLCMTPRGTLLVAESSNNRLQEVKIDEVGLFGGRHVRFVGEGLLEEPNYVTCSESVIAVSESSQHRVTLLSWVDGSLLARFGSKGSGDGQLDWPRGLRLLSDGSGVVVADQWNHRLCIFTATGAFVRSLPTGKHSFDVVEVDGGASFVVANHIEHTLCKVSGASGAVTPFGGRGSGNGQFNGPVALAVVPRGGSDDGVELVVLEAENGRFQVFRA